MAWIKFTGQAEGSHKAVINRYLTDLEEIPDSYSHINAENWVLFDNVGDANNNSDYLQSTRVYKEYGKKQFMVRIR